MEPLVDDYVVVEINFGAPTVTQGLRPIVNRLDPSASPRLRVNQIAGDR
jgi:hypothetical protein